MKNSISEKNIGISLLRILGSFVVVSCHYGRVSEKFAPYRSLAVPCFMMLSFYFFGKTFRSRKIDQHWMVRRISRLLCPYLIWPCIYYVVYKIINIILAVVPVDYKDLGWQLLLGHSDKLCTPLWFHFSLISLTLVFSLICIWKKDNNADIVKWCLALGVLGLYLQYTEINYTTYALERFEVRYPLGRTIEMLPYAAIGTILGYFRFFEKIADGSLILTLLLLFFIFYSIDQLNIINTPAGFGYQGVYLLLLTICIIAIFALLPVELLGQKISHHIDKISTYSLGIYCSHILVGNILNEILDRSGINTETFLDVVWIWGISLIVCVLIGNIPNRIIRNLVL